MDAFYASVEQRDNPELKGKPVAVGGSEKRGVIAAASYEARKFGVRSAMPSQTAAKQCPDLIFVRPRFAVYKEVSQQIRAIMLEYTDLVEPLSLDEAYLDVTENKKGMALATDIANEIRQRIFEKTQLTASAGISMNKFLAKVASDVNKPNGYCLIHPSKAEAFVEKLEIKKFFGVGKATAAKMKKLGIRTGHDLKQLSLTHLINMFGKSGTYYYNICRAIDNREVKPNRKAKSVSVENTFRDDLVTSEEVEEQIKRLCGDLERRIGNRQIAFKTVVIKVRYTDFETLTRNKSLMHYSSKTQDVETLALDLWRQLGEAPKPIRLLGVGISNFQEPQTVETLQLTFDF